MDMKRIIILPTDEEDAEIARVNNADPEFRRLEERIASGKNHVPTPEEIRKSSPIAYKIRAEMIRRAREEADAGDS